VTLIDYGTKGTGQVIVEGSRKEPSRLNDLKHLAESMTEKGRGRTRQRGGGTSLKRHNKVERSSVETSAGTSGAGCCKKLGKRLAPEKKDKEKELRRSRRGPKDKT